MLIRRFSKHLKEQNWLAVGLDFLVVVLGIFVGLQVADWNQARLDRQEAAYHVQFLYDELSEDISLAEAEIQRSTEILEGSFQAAMLLMQDEWQDGAERQFKQHVYQTFELWGPKYRPVSLRRMIDDGKLDLIESKELQQAILQFETAYLDAIEQTRTSYAYSLVVSPKITESLKFSGPQIVSTTEELLSSEVLRGAVRDKAIWQRIQLEVLEELQSARLSLKQALEASPDHHLGPPAGNRANENSSAQESGP